VPRIIKNKFKFVEVIQKKCRLFSGHAVVCTKKCLYRECPYGKMFDTPNNLFGSYTVYLKVTDGQISSITRKTKNPAVADSRPYWLSVTFKVWVQWFSCHLKDNRPMPLPISSHRFRDMSSFSLKNAHFSTSNSTPNLRQCFLCTRSLKFPCLYVLST